MRLLNALLVLGFAGFQIHAKDCDGILKAKKLHNQVLKKNAFTVDNGLAEYTRLLGRDFLRILKSLGSDGHWIDVGAGLAFTQYEMWESKSADLQVDQKDRTSELPFMTAISIKRPKDDFIFVNGVPRAFNRFNKFKYLEGAIQDFEEGEIPKADLVTDNMGAANFAEDVDVAMVKMLRLLKPGGMAFIALKTNRLSIKNEQGRRIAIETWVRQGEGFEVVATKRFTSRGYPGENLRLVIRRTSGRVRLPRLKLVDFVTENLVRTFQIIEE